MTDEDLRSPERLCASLHEAWSLRRPVVVELGVDAGELRAAPRTDRPAYELGATYCFELERLHFLVWANSYDARSGPPIWWHGRKAARRWASAGAREGDRPKGEADVVLADGTMIDVDGGPAFASPSDGSALVVHRYVAEQGSPDTVAADARAAAAASAAAGGEPGPGGTRAELAPDQLAAVLHLSGAARVVAPAGSGKTRVLTERLRYLVADRRVPRGAVTVLAFNTLAAQELRARTQDLASPDGPHIRTINSLGLAICNELGGAGRLRLADAGEVRDIVQRLFHVRRQANADPVAPYLEALSAVRLGLVPPEDAEEAFPDASGLAAGFDDFRQALASAGALDFDEQVYRAIEILLGDPSARRRAQERCRWLLVDEVQDLHPAHLLLVRLLSAPAFDCFGVGDDDQVLYGFSGATPEYLIGYGRLFPGAGEHALEVNYRCPPAVVEATRHLLSYNTRRVTKTIRAVDRPVEPGASGQPTGGLVVIEGAAEELATLAVGRVARWLSEGVAVDDVAVLTRVNAALLAVQVGLEEAGISCTKALAPSVLERTGIRTALAYLRIGSHSGSISRHDLAETIRRPSRGIAPQVVESLTQRRTTSIAEIERFAKRLSGRDAPKLAAYAADLRAVASACGGSSRDALQAVRTRVGLGETMDVLDSSRTQADRASHADDLVALESVAALHEDPATFGAWLRATLERPALGGAAVQLSSVHRVKGREWGRVLVYGVSRGSFPHRLGDDEEGERRVLHVAITRARDEAVLLVDRDAPSSFVAELDGSAPRTVPSTGARGAATPRRASATARRGATDRPAPAVTAEGATAEEALRSWRRVVAARSGVPAYVVLNDSELAGVAQRRPSTLAQLAACRGMGPIRLERWGDEILATLEAASRPAEGSDGAHGG